jgi:hypothetical protein
MDHHVISRLKGHIHKVEDGLLRPGMNQDILGRDVIIQAGDGFSKLRMTQ